MSGGTPTATPPRSPTSQVMPQVRSFEPFEKEFQQIILQRKHIPNGLTTYLNAFYIIVTIQILDLENQKPSENRKKNYFHYLIDSVIEWSSQSIAINVKVFKWPFLNWTRN
jgi:hypothetical protein